MTEGASTSRAARIPAAPFSIAAAAKSWPSTRSPGTAMNRPPAPTCRESNSTDPVTVSSPVALCRRPPVARAISLSVSGIILSPRGRSADGTPHRSRAPTTPVCGAGSWGLLRQACADGRPQLVVVGERVDDSVDLLARLMALARDDHHVARPRAVHRLGDRRAAVADVQDLAAFAPVDRLRARLPGGPDRRRVLGSRVVIGHDQ